MAKTKGTSKKEETKFIVCENSVVLSGKIDKILVSTDKVVIMTIDSTSKTSKGNVAHTWVTVCEFNPEMEYETGDFVEVHGYLNTDSYTKDGKKIYQLRVIADEISVVDEVPFD